MLTEYAGSILDLIEIKSNSFALLWQKMGGGEDQIKKFNILLTCFADF